MPKFIYQSNVYDSLNIINYHSFIFCKLDSELIKTNST